MVRALFIAANQAGLEMNQLKECHLAWTRHAFAEPEPARCSAFLLLTICSVDLLSFRALRGTCAKFKPLRWPDGAIDGAEGPSRLFDLTSHN